MAFDIEVIFIFLWAIVFKDILVGAFLSMLLFVAILLVGLVWVWAHGDLAWVKHLAGASYGAPAPEGGGRRAA